MERYPDYASEIAAQLKTIALDLNDQTLIKLVESIDLNKQDTAAQALAYICENYQIERNVIREPPQDAGARHAAPEVRRSPISQRQQNFYTTSPEQLKR